mgnify:CR=1 FL=1
MTEEEKKTLIEIRERLVKIETILSQQDYRAVEIKANTALDKTKKNEEEISNIRASIKWVVITVIGAFLLALSNIIVNYSWK